MILTKKTQNIFAHSPSLQIVWKCASHRRLITRTLINSSNLKDIYKDVLQYVNSKNRRRSPLTLILDSHLMLGLVYVYSKTVIILYHDVEKLYKDAIAHRFFEFDSSTKLKLTRKKDTILTSTQWQIDIDENLLPDETMLLERDFAIEIPRQPTPPASIHLSNNLPPLPWEVSKPTHGKRITQLPDIEEPSIPKFDIIDDRFGEPLPPTQPTTAMDIDQRHDQTFFRAASDDRNQELLQAPRADRHMSAIDRYVHPSEDRTINEQRSIRSKKSIAPPIPMPLIETISVEPDHSTSTSYDQFSTEALAFMTNSMNTYPIYGPMPTATVLLGVDCTSSSKIPLILVQEPTVIVADEMGIQMDTLPQLDQQAPHKVPAGMNVDAQVPDVVVAPSDEKTNYHISKKKRNMLNALHKKRKDSLLYEDIIKFDYEILQSIEEKEEEEFIKNKHEQKPWSTLIGRNGRKRMNQLLEKAKITMTSTHLNGIIDDIAKIEKILAHPSEYDDLIQVRRTGQEMAIRRGQSSGLLPIVGTRSPSSLVPPIQDRISQLPVRTTDGDTLPPLPSGFDEIPLILPPSEPLVNIPQLLSPLRTARRGRTTVITSPVESSPTCQQKQKQKQTAIDAILNMADNSDGGLFNQFLRQSNANRIQAALYFGLLLILCSEGRLKVYQKESYGEINIFINDKYRTMKQNEQHTSHVGVMESDNSTFAFFDEISS